MNDSSRVTQILAGFSALVGIIATAVSVFISVRVNDLDERLKLADSRLKEAIEKRVERQTDQELSLKTYDKVAALIEANEPRKHRVALALVNSLEDDRPLKKYLLVLLRTDMCGQQRRGAPELQELCKEAGVSLFNTEERATPVAEASASKAIDYDIFWCEDEPRWEQVANAAATLLRRKKDKDNDVAIGRVRVRSLPRDVNREQRFQVTLPAIRYDSDEESAAKALKQLLDPVLADANVGDQRFQPLPNKTSALRTPSYLSAYVCGVASR